MTLPDLPYLTYARTHYITPRYNLASSNVPNADLHALYPTPDDLRLAPEALNPALEDLLAQRYNVSPAQVLVTPGTTGANAALAAAIAHDGPADWLVETPGYEPLHRTPALYGLRVHTFQRPTRLDRACVLDTDALQDALQHLPNPRLVALTNPHNPSGRLASPGALAFAADLAARRGAHLLVDEVYLDFTQPLGGPASALHLADNVVITSSLTKVYGLGALRVGWIIGPEPLIQRARIAQLHHIGPHATPSLAFALRALRELDDLKDRATAHLRGRLTTLSDAFLDHPDLRWLPPDTGVVGLLHLPPDTDDLLVAQRLRDLAQIIVAPGAFFGYPGTLRLGFGAHPAPFQTALQAFLHTIEVALAHP